MVAHGDSFKFKKSDRLRSVFYLKFMKTCYPPLVEIIVFCGLYRNLNLIFFDILTFPRAAADN